MSGNPNWGDVPTWLAVAAALYAGIGAVKLLKVERDRDTKNDEREIRSQANQIAGWIEPEVINFQGGSPFYASVNVRLSNPSEQPVYDVNVTIFKGEAPLDFVKYAILSPGSKQDKRIPSDHLSHVVPEIYDVVYFNDFLARQDAQLVSDQFNIAFNFQDTSGIRWGRDYEGKLDREDPPDFSVKLGHTWGTRLRKLIQKGGN